MMSMRFETGSLFTLTFLVVAGTLHGQAPQAPAVPPKPDTPAVTQHIDLARKAAGTEWTQAVDFICKVNPDRANRVDDPLIAPTKIFDNVYAIGRTGTVVHAITTSAGLVLIDAGYADQLETVLLPGLRRSASTRTTSGTSCSATVMATTSAAPPTSRTGARVVLSAADWDLMGAPAPARGGGAPAPAAPRPPKRDMVATEGQAITVGDVSFTPVAIPGHTPGSMGYIFPVKDGARTHIAGLFGGSILIPGPHPRRGPAAVHPVGGALRRDGPEDECRSRTAEPPALRRSGGQARAAEDASGRAGPSVRCGSGLVSALPDGDDRVHPGANRAEKALMLICWVSCPSPL